MPSQSVAISYTTFQDLEVYRIQGTIVISQTVMNEPQT